MDPEADYALKLYKEGFVREIYSRTDGKGALVCRMLYEVF